jgi:hypothetical protein
MSQPEKTIHDLFNLTGKVALLTGAAGWLGSARAPPIVSPAWLMK